MPSVADLMRVLQVNVPHMTLSPKPLAGREKGDW